MRCFDFRLSLAFWVASAGFLVAEDSVTEPRPVPLTRPEMKQYLENMKSRKPRIPLPELTDEDREKLGERGQSYESRLRYHYLPGGERRASGPGNGTAPRAQGGGFGRDNDPEMTLSYKFKTELFWIVSRTNNCQYCLGHQESKLLGAGMTEDEIAALDSDWESFPEADQAAFQFARKLTYEPHLLCDADIDLLRAHFTDLQILEMILSMAGNNSINRWKEGAGIPQSQNGGGFGRRSATTGQPAADAASRTDRHESYLTPTSERFLARVTRVAPLSLDEQSGQPTRKTVSRRPPLESRGEVEQLLAAAKHRKARLPLVDEAKARELVAGSAAESVLPQWIRLLANFPTSAPSRIESIQSAETRGDLSPLLKAQVSWVIARQDRAWYAVAEAAARLRKLGQSDDQIFALDGDSDSLSPELQSQLTLARKLAATPVVLTDTDVTRAVELTSPREVTQLISFVTHRASFDRITEAAGLPVEP